MARQLRRSGALTTLAPPARRPAPRVALRPDFGERGRGITQFLIDVRAELRKVVWPTREEIVKLTGLVVGISLVVGTFLGLIDFAFTKLFQLIVG